jgi:hypothetical protein
MNPTTFLRFYLLYILFNIGGWVYFGYLSYYSTNLTTQTCNSYIKEITDAIKIFVGIAMSMTTINILVATKNILTHYDEIIFDNLFCIFTVTIIFLSMAGINSMLIFCITSGMTELKCSDNNTEFGIKLAVYGFIWIVFIEALFISFAIMRFLYSVILNAKLHELCNPCFDICKKYNERRVAVEPTIPKYNNNHVLVPINALKEDNKILCSICYDSAITLFLEPCNHICICELCYNSLISKECPICKTGILMTKKVFFVSPNLI